MTAAAGLIVRTGTKLYDARAGAKTEQPLQDRGIL